MTEISLPLLSEWECELEGELEVEVQPRRGEERRNERVLEVEREECSGRRGECRCSELSSSTKTHRSLSWRERGRTTKSRSEIEQRVLSLRRALLLFHHHRLPRDCFQCIRRAQLYLPRGTDLTPSYLRPALLPRNKRDLVDLQHHGEVMGAFEQ